MGKDDDCCGAEQKTWIQGASSEIETNTLQQIEQGRSLSHAAKHWWAKAIDVARFGGFSEGGPGPA